MKAAHVRWVYLPFSCRNCVAWFSSARSRNETLYISCILFITSALTKTNVAIINLAIQTTLTLQCFQHISTQTPCHTRHTLQKVPVCTGCTWMHEDKEDLQRLEFLLIKSNNSVLSFFSFCKFILFFFKHLFFTQNYANYVGNVARFLDF